MFRVSNFVILVLSLAVASTASAQDYVWPMKLKPELTSRFCDYRSGHFHAGLDIRSMGKTGYRVYAVDKGYIFRITTSFTGYGKAVYVRLADGRIAVYGHLSGFGDEMDERIRRIQMKDKRYKQDLYFAPGELPVKKGQIIGYSGSSGAGAPHLHFEIRSAANNPLNPLKYGFAIPDGSPPVFDKLAVRHYERGFNPGAPCRIEFLDVSKGSEPGEFAIGDTVIADGFLALAISGGDRVDGAGYIYGYYSLGVALEGRPIFSMRSDSISYETTGQLDYIRDMKLSYLSRDSGRRDNDENVFFRLYIPPGSRQFFWDGSYGAGIIQPGDFAGQVRQVEITAEDESGNRSTLRFAVKTPSLLPPRPEFVSYYRFGDTVMVDFLTFQGVEGVEAQSRSSEGQRFVDLDCKFLMDTWFSGNDTAFANSLTTICARRGDEYRFMFFDDAGNVSPWIYFIDGSGKAGLRLSGSPEHLRVSYLADSVYKDLSLTLRAASETREMDMFQDGIQAFHAELMGSGLEGPVNMIVGYDGHMLVDSTINLYPAIPGRSLNALSDDSTLSVMFKDGSAFYPAYIFPSNGVRGFVLGGRALIYDVEPAFFIAESPVIFNFDLGRLGFDEATVGVYGYSVHNDKWGFIGKTEGSRLAAEGFGLGRIALVEDDEPPIISNVLPRGRIRSRKPQLSCTIRDRISGVDTDQGLSMEIDGIWVPAEFDPDTGKYSYRVKNNLRPGRHSLEIESYDRQGNVNRFKRQFTILGR
jgi:hypothetical protein